MVKNSNKIASRNRLKQKSYSIINIFGLITGIAACILISLNAAQGSSCSASCEMQKQQKNSAPEFSFWTVGDGFRERFGESAYKKLSTLRENKYEFNCLLQSLAFETQTKQEILDNCSISPSWLNQAIDTLISINFLEKSNNSEYYTKVPVMTDAEMKRIQESLKPIASRVADKIREHVPDIKQIYYKTKSESDPNWDYISHLVIDKYLIDGCFHHGLTILEQENGIKKYYSQDQKKVPVFFLESGSEYGPFGVNWYGFKNKNTERNVYILHGALFKRLHIPFNQYGRKKDFSEVFLRIHSNGSLEDLTEEEIQIFRNLGWVDHDKLVLPFIRTSSLKTFKNDLENLGNQAAEIVFKNFSVILNSFENSTYSKYSQGAGDYIQVCYHILFSGIIKELIETDVIPPIPDLLPDSFGVYITMGSNFFDD